MKLQEENTNAVYVSKMAIIATLAHLLQNSHRYVQNFLNYLYTQSIYTAAIVAVIYTCLQTINHSLLYLYTYLTIYSFIYLFTY